MQQLEVCHDNSGISPGWHLAWVRVTNLSTGAAALFPCNMWLATNEGDKKISRTLETDVPAAPPPPPAAVAMVRVTQPELPPLTHKTGMSALGSPGYKLLFVTSNVCMAGTGAPVFFELVGEYGSSGKQYC
jgi:hypothetical protein